MVTGESSQPASAERRLKELGIKVPTSPEPFGTYVEAVRYWRWKCDGGCRSGNEIDFLEKY